MVCGFTRVFGGLFFSLSKRIKWSWREQTFYRYGDAFLSYMVTTCLVEGVASALFLACHRLIINTRVLHSEYVLSVRDPAGSNLLDLNQLCSCQRLASFFLIFLFHPLLIVTTVASMCSNDQMEWLPGLGIQSRSGSEIFGDVEHIRDTQAIDPSVDEVQFSIVCEDCGKHFWSRSKANSHAALTTHVLHEDDAMPDSPVTIPESPTTSPASTHTLAEACRDVKSAGQEDSEDKGGDGCGSSFDYSEFSYYYEAANKDVSIECTQDVELVPSSTPDESPATGILSAAVDRDIPDTDSSIHPSIHPSSPSWSARYARLPNTTTTGASTSTSPVYKGVVVPTTRYGTSSETSDLVLDPLRKQSLPPFAPNVSQ